MKRVPDVVSEAAAFGIQLSGPVATGEVEVRHATAVGHLSGPPGVLHGGTCAALCLLAARAADRFHAPPTYVHIALRRPTPLNHRLTTRVRRLEAADYAVEVADESGLLVRGTVSLAGRDVAPRVPDLLDLVFAPVPAPLAEHKAASCWVCGYDDANALRLKPGLLDDGRVITEWLPGPEHGDGTGKVAPELVCAILDCQASWAAGSMAQSAESWSALADYRVTFFGDAPADEVLRIVAVPDRAAGRKLEARSALISEEGAVYATAAALVIEVDAYPSMEATSG